MLVFKCKMCGGTIEFQPGDTIGVCDSCGTKQTLPRLDSDRKANLYDRANHFRRNNEFDKAMGIYETILNEDPTDAEAYWSIVLCRYGIEYVEDPATRRRVPTVNRAQFTSIFDDEDYKSALKNADALQRMIYEDEAKAINEIQKGILEISAKEEPFDVFICYKETDANGRRTPDSVLATDLYHQLTREDFKVFLSRITLENKLGQEYEPYIFAALNSAKAMVVLGTKPEHFNAVWVKNEWSRYLALIKAGANKTLIPAYRDMDPYDLPEEFSHLQAQDMSKLGFMQDLIRGIKKIIRTDEPKPTIRETVVQQAAQTNTAPLLRRAFMFLEDGNFSSADEYCEKVLDLEPENAEAYLGKLMAELHVRAREVLKDQPEPFDDRSNYKKAYRFGDEKLKAELSGETAFIKDRNETARKEGIYQSACSQMTGSSVSGYESAIKAFRTIPGWKNADEQILACQRKIEEIKAKEEADRLERKRKAEKARIAEEKAAKKRKRTIAIVTPVIIACIAFVIVLTTVIIPKQKLNKAMGLLDSGYYEAVYALLEEIGNSEAIASSKYERAVSLIGSGDYDAALLLLDGLNYKDSAVQIENCYIGKMGKEKYNLIKNIKVGDTYTFGAYEQDNKSSNGKEDIEWIVLDRKGSSVLLISKYALDCQKYNAWYSPVVTWETCSLRKWLNGTFLNAAFTSEEQNSIISSTVTADKNPSYSISPGNNTTDKVFLLSITEVKKHFSSDEARKCAPTDYAIAQSARTSDSNKTGGSATCFWWLRSPGASSSYAAGVFAVGSVHDYGVMVDDCEPIRPALWIKLPINEG
ncbi:MAG: TIR domain-containing protein [Clostridia bacterium]|nr:TIR domain-containing protein [Clostridia bacterium]